MEATQKLGFVRLARTLWRLQALTPLGYWGNESALTSDDTYHLRWTLVVCQGCDCFCQVARVRARVQNLVSLRFFFVLFTILDYLD